MCRQKPPDHLNSNLDFIRMLKQVALMVLMSCSTALGREWSNGQVEAEEASLVADNVPVPCFCNTYPKLMDLGHDSYPRYIASVECRYESCWTTPYHCHEHTYKIKILRRRDEVDEMFSRHDLNLPEALRPSWKFVSVPVAVACQCSP